MFTVIDTLEEFYQATKHPAVLFYFSHENCNVCKTLKPKVEEFISQNFPEVKLYYVDTVKSPDIAGQNRVFTNPVVLIYLDGRESHRFSRYFSLQNLYEALAKPYEIIFS